MHLHGPFICQYGVQLNYPPFSEYDIVIESMQSKFAEIVSVKKVTKSKYVESRVPVCDCKESKVIGNVNKADTTLDDPTKVSK